MKQDWDEVGEAEEEEEANEGRAPEFMEYLYV